MSQIEGLLYDVKSNGAHEDESEYEPEPMY